MNKSDFANTMAEMKTLSSSMTECEKLGMTWGCQEDCPVLVRGDCRIYTCLEEFVQNQDK